MLRRGWSLETHNDNFPDASSNRPSHGNNDLPCPLMDFGDRALVVIVVVATVCEPSFSSLPFSTNGDPLSSNAVEQCGRAMRSSGG